MKKSRETGPQASKPNGRPPIYDKDFHPQECIELGRKGKSVTEICNAFDIMRETYYNWTKTHKEFSDAHKKATQLKEEWYTAFGQNLAAGKIKGGNVTAYIWLTKQLCGWRDKVELIDSDNPEWENE